jgi:hypothetical protein
MVPSPVQRAASLVAKVVEIVLAAYRANDDPENDIGSLIPRKFRERLYDLRTLKNSADRVGPVHPVAPRTRRPRAAAGAHRARRGVEGMMRSMFDFADQQLGEAMEALGEVDAQIADRYLENVARKHMAACLDRKRAKETPAEPAALPGEVNNASRESDGFEPLDGEQVTAVPGGGLLRRGVGERRQPGERHRPRALRWRYPQVFQSDHRPSRRPAVARWRRPASTPRRRRQGHHGR